jgi:hypothetical protein
MKRIRMLQSKSSMALVINGKAHTASTILANMQTMISVNVLLTLVEIFH